MKTKEDEIMREIDLGIVIERNRKERELYPNEFIQDYEETTGGKE